MLTLEAFTPGLPVFLDTETTGLNPRTDTLVLVILAQEGEPLVIDWREAWPSWADVLSELLSQSVLIAHNAKFDVSFLRTNGVKVGKVWCTQVAEQVLRGVGLEDSRVQGIPLSLAGLAANYGVRTKPVSKAEREWFYTELPKDLKQDIPEAQLRYAAEDVKLLRDIYQKQREELAARDDQGQTNLWPVLDLEMRVLPALVDVELAGIRIDVEQWRTFIAEKQAEAKTLEDQVLETFGEAIVGERIRQFDGACAEFMAWEAAEDLYLSHLKAEWHDWKGEAQPSWGQFKRFEMEKWRTNNPRPDRPKLDTSPPNVNSSTQLLNAFHILGLPFETTDSKKLAPYADEHPALKVLMAHRKAEKFVTSFGETLLAHVEADGRIHPEYNQIGASTGRMSCTRPNWQQIPSRGDGKRLRQCVVASPGHLLLTADFSNIEMRILAEYSRDPRLLDFFDRDVDLHSEVARLMFSLGPEVNPKTTACPAVPGWSYRDVAKTINYGLVYGMSASRLSRTALIAKEEAQRLMDSYFSLFPGVVEWLKKAREMGWSRKFSRTMLGRIRPYRVPDQKSMNRREWDQLKARVERQSMNTPIQGTSADITKEALACFYELSPVGRVVAVVHDELVVEVREEDADQATLWLETAMNDAQRAICHITELPRVALTVPDVHPSERWEK